MQLKNIPVIDLSPITDTNCDNLNSSPKISKLVDNIRRACIDWGFFYIIGHSIDEELIRKIRAVAKDFFDQSKEIKRTLKRQPKNFHGFWEYGFEGKKKGWRETFDFGMPQKSILHSVKHDDLFHLDSGENIWPDVKAMPKFRIECESWITKMHSLATHLAELIFLGLGTDPKTIMHHFGKTRDSASCRLNYYPICPDQVEDKFGVGAHTDYGGFTILLQDDDVNSLQVERDGHWYEVPAIPGSFVVNTGGMIQIWSNGLIKAPVHRVVTNSEKDRYSVPFFFNPSYSTNVEPLKSCITPENPCRFRSVNWGKYFWSKMVGDKNNEYGEELQIHHFEIPLY